VEQGKLLKIPVTWLGIAFLLAIATGSGHSLHMAASATQGSLYQSSLAEAPGAPADISVYTRVEGQDDTIWKGNVTVAESDITADNSGKICHLPDPTPLGALDEASGDEGEFQYYVTDQYGALFVSSVVGEEPQGARGWMYRVDYRTPGVGADQFILGETTPPDPPHEEVLWYYGNWGDAPLRISLSDTEVYAGDEFTATVTYYSDESDEWLPCEGATVRGAGRGHETGSDGTVDIGIDSEGTFRLFAEKDGCIRSDRIRIRVTTPEPETCTLTMRVDGNGSTTPSVGRHTYHAGTTVDISAAADAGWEFDSWSGDAANPSSSSTTVTVDADKSVVANFIETSPALYTLTATCEPNGGGSLTLSPQGKANQYEAGASVKLTATPAAGYIFSTWGGDLDSGSNPASVTMDSNKEVIASFVMSASGRAAGFSASNLTISPDQVQANQQVNISINITNVGRKTGSYEAVLYVNEQVEDSQTVRLSPGSTQDLVFLVSRTTPGIYDVSLAEVRGRFTVVGGQASGGALDTNSMVAIVIIMALVVAIVLVFRRIKNLRRE
jgi:hypothetical protein